MSLCHSDDYKYDDYQYDEYHENYDYDNQKLEDYTDDYSQDYDYYTNQNLLASLNPPPTPPAPLPPQPPMGKMTFFLFRYDGTYTIFTLKSKQIKSLLKCLLFY